MTGLQKGRSLRLFAWIDSHYLDESIRQRTKERLIQVVFDDQATVVAKSSLADVGIRVGTKNESVVPRDVEGKCFYSLLVGEVVKLLKDQGSQDDIEVFGGSTDPVVEMAGELSNRQMFQQMVPEDAGPGLGEEFEGRNQSQRV